MEVPDRHTLGTDETFAEDVVGVASHRHHLVALEGQFEAAGGFTQRADVSHAHVRTCTWNV